MSTADRIAALRSEGEAAVSSAYGEDPDATVDLLADLAARQPTDHDVPLHVTSSTL